MSGHHHGHSHGTKNKKRLIAAMAIIGSWMFVELVGAIWTGSLALLADATHMLSDFLNLLISFVAIVFATRAATKKRTFGYHRLEILAALANGLALIGVSVYIIYEAIDRFANPSVIHSGPMIVIAAIGLIANIGALIVLTGDSAKSNLNMRGAYLHVLGDTLGSISAIAAGIIMLVFQWYWVDPLLSILISILIAVTAVRLLKDTLHVLMEGTPDQVHIDEVESELLKIKGVTSVHHLHIWSLSSEVHSFSCHLVLDVTNIDQQQQITQQVNDWVKDHLHIDRCTVQVETSADYACQHVSI